VITSGEAIANIVREEGKYAIYAGAGMSAEAGVPTADAICRDVRADLAARELNAGASVAAINKWARVRLDWDDPEVRYLRCIERGYRTPAHRLSYFRGILHDRQPAFCHHAVALLMHHDVVTRTCLTTNFDHLLESAFTQLELPDCQAIRRGEEAEFWQEREQRCFVIKLHGDIDTWNIRNTAIETVRIEQDLAAPVERLADNAGLVVLGSAGNEESVRALFTNIEQKNLPSTFAFGLLWGVYMGDTRPLDMTRAKELRLLKQRVNSGVVHRGIRDLLGRSQNDLWAFFPVWGAGGFLDELVAATAKPELIARARSRLDHEMRLRRIFRGAAGLSEQTVLNHLQSLRDSRRSFDERRAREPAPVRIQKPDWIVTAAAEAPPATVRIAYGDILDVPLSKPLAPEDSRRVAIVSPEDRYISAGGGVAYKLLVSAGADGVLNELEKFAPIPQRAVAVTSAGALPAHYIVHAAALEILEGPEYHVTAEDVEATMREVLAKCAGLDVDAVFVPMLGTGVAKMDYDVSLRALLRGIAAWQSDRDPAAACMTIVIVVFQEKYLARATVLSDVEQLLGGGFDVTPA
jgi:O-acetyl-ADP-ribose deacetylase (regulator of RNase III)